MVRLQTGVPMPQIVPVKVGIAVQANSEDVPGLKQNQIAPLDTPLNFDNATGQASYEVDFSQLQNAKQFGAVQTLVVNNQSNPNALTIIYRRYNVSFVCPPYSYGYFPVQVQTPAKIEFATTQAAGLNVMVWALNYTVPLAVYNVASGGVGPNAPLYVRNVTVPSARTFTKTAMSGADQTPNAANANRAQLLMQAASGNAASIYLQFGGAAVSGQGIELQPGQSINMDPSLIDQSALHCIGTAADILLTTEWNF